MSTVFGPPVVSGVIKYRLATILASIFIFLGAWIGGTTGVSTVSAITQLSILSAISVSLSAAIVTLVMTSFSIPTSITQGVIGAVVGIGILESVVNWELVIKLVAFWALTPLGAILLSFFLFKFIAVLYQRMKSVRKRGTFVRILSLSAGIYAAYSLGANNLAIVSGQFTSKGMLNISQALAFGGLAMALGTFTASKKVIYAVGKDITKLDPLGSAVALVAESTALLGYSLIGVPTSSAQAVVGAVIGVGLVKGTKMINNRTLLKIISGWLITPFATGTVAVIIYMVLLKFWR
ncbi:inorganic phosphate transporter [Mesoaciditoga lauensis]|uniref:inorganic phosphate transporter n=1 Tax=Mesoaciditoga lauensis TaxID=1495039 RepID=UPI00068A84DE|nr:inorganic phosphate transporter [Mesoaciditoga lauensis]